MENGSNPKKDKTKNPKRLSQKPKFWKNLANKEKSDFLDSISMYGGGGGGNLL
jgi:hypothetical protein